MEIPALPPEKRVKKWDVVGTKEQTIYAAYYPNGSILTATGSGTLDGETLLQPILMELRCSNMVSINCGSPFHGAVKDVAELINPEKTLPGQFKILNFGDGRELAQLDKPGYGQVMIELGRDAQGRLDVASRRVLAILDCLPVNSDLTGPLLEQIGTYGMIIQETTTQHVSTNDAFVLCLPEKMAELFNQCLIDWKKTGNDEFKITQEWAEKLLNLSSLGKLLFLPELGKAIVEPKILKPIRIGNKGDGQMLYGIYQAFQEAHLVPHPLGVFIDRY